jgi:putative addiction module antidote
MANDREIPQNRMLRLPNIVKIQRNQRQSHAEQQNPKHHSRSPLARCIAPFCCAVAAPPSFICAKRRASTALLPHVSKYSKTLASKIVVKFVITMKTSTKLSPRGNSLAVTIPKDMLDATGLKQGDSVDLTAREDGVIEIRHAAPGDAALDEAFEWSLGRYPQTYRDLAK